MLMMKGYTYGNQLLHTGRSTDMQRKINIRREIYGYTQGDQWIGDTHTG